MQLLSDATMWAMDPGHLRAFLAAYHGQALLRGQVDPVDPAEAPEPAWRLDEAGTAIVTIAGPMLPGANPVLDYFGVAYCDMQATAAALRELATDPRVRQVVLRIDSPGGAVDGTQALAAAVAALSVPVTAQVRGCCASAAYWVAAQADRIEASAETDLIGSLGVFSALIDTSAAAAALGVTVHLIASGPLKGQGYVDGAPIAPEAIAEARHRIAATAAVFFAAVAAGRPALAGRLAELGTGATWIASEALGLGLIDHIHITTAGQAPAQPRKEPPMDAEIFGLIKAHPEQAALIADQAEQGASLADIRAAITTAGHQARIAELEAQLVQRNEEIAERLGAIQADLAALTAERDDLRAKLTEADAKLAALEALGTSHADPGPSDADGTPRRSAMSEPEKQAFCRAHGVEAYQALPWR